MPATKTFCFHAGRIAGAIEDGMTFRDRAREKTPPDLLKLADEAVARARELKPICMGDDDIGRDYALVWNKLWALAGLNNDEALNTKILNLSCAEAR